ncbi:MAG: energy transducer TonB, partial [Desulfobacterales bacterium]|nr:energy transducer TonB [Desulfobacterales bacterium]
VVREAMPLYRINPAPKYPKIARRRGYKGTVVLEVLVDRNGRVDDLRVSTSSGYKILDKAALASVKDWAFEPGMRGDQKVEMWVRVPVRFQLN